jgi:hypothetical protein
VGTHLGVCGFIPSHFPTLSEAWNLTLGFHSQPTPLQVLALVANLSSGSRDMMKNVFLNTLELKNALGWSQGQLMCHESCCKLATNGNLGKDNEKKSKMHFGHLELFWALKCSREHLMEIIIFWIPAPRSLVLN